MAYDSLYGAMLKTIAPYEFYRTLLTLYTNKGQKDKISLAADEMMANKGIKFNIGKFGQDNTDWYIDKEKRTISQEVSSIKFMSKQAAIDLYKASIDYTDRTHFVDLLDYLKNNTCLNRRQFEILIWINYFEQFGGTKKLTEIMKEYFDGPNKCSSNPKSKLARMEALRKLEEEMPNEELDIHARLTAENDNIGLTFSKDETAVGKYFVAELEERYGCHAQLYNCATGKMTPVIRIAKNVLEKIPFKTGDMLMMTRENMKERIRYRYKDGKRYPTEDKDWWIDGYKVIQKPELKPKKKKGEEDGEKEN